MAPTPHPRVAVKTPQALQIGPAWPNGNPGFIQQGQVDWVAFGNTIWTASAAVLQRFASSGIQPVTFGAGIALASRFRMSANGRQRMDQTMRSLRGMPGLDKVLWFGFGYQSFVKLMGESQLGINCVALCSCLTEVHSEETAARVLGSLWELNGYPEEYEPSHSQFLALVKACSGTISRSGFGRELDAMTGHGLWKFGRNRAYHSGLKASNATDIAKALGGLFQITRHSVETITLVGQNECAFIAAFGKWLFDLSIYVEDDAGLVLFKSHEGLTIHDAQVLVRYSQDEEPDALQQSTTFVLPVGTDLVSQYVSSSESRWILKVPWDGCLLRAFGSTFRDLTHLTHVLGSFLGGVARIYTALATGEPKVATFSRVRFIDFTELSYGKGFVHSVTSVFAELGRVSGLNDTMERALGASFENASKEVEQAALSLRSTCHCGRCCGRPSSDADSDSSLDLIGECLFVLAMTIRSLVTALASTSRDEDLSVAVYGLQSYYAESRAAYAAWLEQNDNQQTFFGMAVGLASVSDPEDTLVTKSETLIHDIRTLFDGSLGVADLPQLEGTTATAASGICCYRECLRAFSSKAAAMRVIHIVSGHIERGTTQYDVVRDGRQDNRIFPISEPVTLTQVEGSNFRYETTKLGRFEVKALATESSTYRALDFYYKVLLPNGSAAQIQPGLLSDQVLGRTGVLSCYRGKKCKKQLAFPCSAVQKGWTIAQDNESLHYNSGIALCIWSNQDDVLRCVAFDLHNQSYLSPSTTFLRRDECLPCCSESILRESAAILTELGQDRKVLHVM